MLTTSQEPEGGRPSRLGSVASPRMMLTLAGVAKGGRARRQRDRGGRGRARRQAWRSGWRLSCGRWADAHLAAPVVVLDPLLGDPDEARGEVHNVDALEPVRHHALSEELNIAGGAPAQVHPHAALLHGHVHHQRLPAVQHPMPVLVVQVGLNARCGIRDGRDTNEENEETRGRRTRKTQAIENKKQVRSRGEGQA